MRQHTVLAAALALTAAACGPNLHPLRPVMANGEVLPSRTDEVVDRARASGEAERARLAEQRDRVDAAALAGCTGRTCDAIARGEVELGMTEAQVLAATRTTAAAWETRGSGRAVVMTGRFESDAPTDAVGEITYLTLQNGVVRGITYREPHGFRTVSSPADATLQGRAAAQAEALLREGDDFAVRGDLRGALDRYDRADVLRPGDPETTLRIARALDKALRPYEALIRYQMFLHQMELERIRATGEAYGHLAAAIAQARERVVVLERRR
ncbi:MAG TPA: hypothetical protein VHG28_05190 [Longimicrobiaceae bacterium]|nr:hypothetical protein [Longimicrobiaceae bacterium]